MNEKVIENRIERVKAELQAIGLMRPGSLNKQFTICGRKNCCCQDSEAPKKHGPYYQLSYIHKGKSTTQFIRDELVGEVMEQLANYKRFRALSDELVDLSLSLARERLKRNRERLKKTSRKG